MQANLPASAEFAKYRPNAECLWSRIPKASFAFSDVRSVDGVIKMVIGLIFQQSENVHAMQTAFAWQRQNLSDFQCTSAALSQTLKNANL